MIFTNKTLASIMGGLTGFATGGFKAGFSWGPSQFDFDYCSVIVGTGGYAYPNGANYQINVYNDPLNGNLITAEGIGVLWSGPYTSNTYQSFPTASINPSLSQFVFAASPENMKPFYLNVGPGSIQSIGPAPSVTGGTFQGTANPTLAINTNGFYRSDGVGNLNTRYNFCPNIQNINQKIIFNTTNIIDLGLDNGVFIYSGVNNNINLNINTLNATPTPTPTLTLTPTNSPTPSYDCLLVFSECAFTGPGTGSIYKFLLVL
jgi:hypothetical protein